MKQQAEYPLIPPGDAVVLSPLQFVSFEPDVILVYGNPAQMCLLMNGIQFTDYEPLRFSFVGEGACTDSLARCYVTGRSALWEFSTSSTDPVLQYKVPVQSLNLGSGCTANA